VECRSNAFLGVSTAGSWQTNTEKGFDEAMKRDEKGFDEAMKRELHVKYTHIECSSAGSR
jgi:hypothetical protein